MNGPNIDQIIDLLSKAYGEKKWKRSQDPISELIRTVLSQNTSDTNSYRAFDSLMSSFNGWEDIAASPPPLIADAIRMGGLANVKAVYIKNVLTGIVNRHGNFDLEFLGRLPVAEARAWLMRLPGVGMKTASCVLLFALGMPALPVDTHVFRVAKRLGLVPHNITVDQAHIQLEDLVRPDDMFRFHVLLIEHGRKTCKAQRPYCNQCALGKLCPGYEDLVKFRETAPR